MKVTEKIEYLESLIQDEVEKELDRLVSNVMRKYVTIKEFQMFQGLEDFFTFYDTEDITLYELENSNKTFKELYDFRNYMSEIKIHFNNYTVSYDRSIIEQYY